MKLMEYLYRILTGGNKEEFSGIITECRRSGVFVEIVEVNQRGLVKIEDFPRGNWRLENGTHRYSASGGRTITLGQKVKMKLVRVDLEHQQIDLKIIKYDNKDG